ncbi:hypothetical protein [Pelagovum pacificum]|uniref:Uncharacterized protein n=1 Tax=Pelagovum pacificum TaxID=2588711 RepID=A0A5C5GHE7_9RHOB|nr:hypothetical protein [Pelagovum pacificum]QQA45064.1 hypothetical protein I8N54_18055 [Pelagovum pacificum]TNY34192.1 hypothetical protein FHY64_13335 [Pelagovum pacificum]
MRRTATFALAALLTILPLAGPAVAQSLRQPVGGAVRQGPPMSYGARYWTDPATGCSYSRAQAPGYAPTWHLIINGTEIGLTDAHRGCPGMLVSGG